MHLHISLILYAVFIVHGALHSQNTFHTVVYVHSGFLYYNLKYSCQRGHPVSVIWRYWTALWLSSFNAYFVIFKLFLSDINNNYSSLNGTERKNNDDLQFHQYQHYILTALYLSKLTVRLIM